MRIFGKESTAPDQGVDRENGKGWLQDHCALILVLTVIIALLLRTVFAYGFSADNGFALSGGSEAQYHLHVVESILSGSFIFGADAAINYPMGGLNVIPPVYDFIAAALGAVISPSAALAVLAPIFGALTVIPVYLIGKELYGCKAGIVSALVFAFLALPICSSVFSNGTEYAFVAFLVGFFILEFIKVVREFSEGNVDRKDCLLAGGFLGLIALSWNGFRVLLLMIIIVMVIQMLIDRFNSKDVSTALYTYSPIMLIGIVIGALYYIPAGLWDAVFSGPVLITVVTIVLGFVFKTVQSKPWIITVPALVLVFVILAVVLCFVAPDYCTALIFGNSAYANAEIAKLAGGAITISKMASYFGWLTLWLPIILGMYEFYLYARKDRSHIKLFTAMWLIVLWFCAWGSYGNAAVLGTVFAVGSGALIVMVLEKADLRTYAANIKAAGFPGCFRKIIKPLPFLSVLIMAFLIIVPNVSYAVDAGIPANDDNTYYFTGNTSFVIEAGDAYPYSYIWDDLSDVPKEGAIATWIDYASGAVAKGGFDAVDDLRGSGSSAVAQIYLADGGAGATAASIVRIMMSTDADLGSAFPSSIYYVTLKGLIQNPSEAISLVLSDVDKYGSVRSDISGENAVYLAAIDYILTYFSTGEIMDIYEKIGQITGDRIGYFVVDGSMATLAYGDGSILSTIAYLAGYTTDKYGMATQFVTCPYAAYGYTVAEGTDALYETFLWKALVGPSPAQAGFSSSAEYLSALATSTGTVKPMPGYALAGFDVIDWYVKYNPKASAVAADDGWVFMTCEDAVALQEKEGGVINYLSSVIALQYLGSTDNEVSGTVVNENGKGIAGVTVKVSCYNDAYESSWIYAETKTMDNGSFSVPIPYGESYKLLFSNGTVNLETVDKSGSYVVESASFLGKVMLGDDIYDASCVYTLTKNGVSYKIQSVGGFLDSDDAVDAYGDAAVLTPGTYAYTLSDSTAAAIASGNITLYTGFNDGLVVSVTSYTITATVNDEFGQGIPSGTFIAVNTTTGDSFFAPIENGKAVATVPNGSYIMSLTDGWATVNSTTLTVSSNKTTTISAVPAKVISVSGYDDVVLSVYAGSFATTVFNGKVSIPTSFGTDRMLYMVYGADAENVYIGKINEGTSSLSLVKSKACEVSGNIGASGSVSFIDSNGAMITAAADKSGEFTAFVAPGDYTVYISSSSKVYLGKLSVAGDMEFPSVSLVSSKTISGTFNYASGTSKFSMGLAYAYAEVSFTYDGKTYSLTSMTDANGKVSFPIPADATGVKIMFNAGSIDNVAFKSDNLVAEIDDDTSNSSKTITIPEKDKKSVTVSAPYKMTLDPYSGDELIEFNGSATLVPGQYTATIEASTGYLFNGTVYVYPGVTHFIGLNPTKVYTVQVVTGPLDVLTITGDKSYDNPDDDDMYYFEYDCEYFLKTYNASTGMVKFGYINGPVTSIDMVPTSRLISISGNTSVVADGELTVTYGSTKIVEDIKSGAYSLELPGDAAQVTLSASVKATIGGADYGFTGMVTQAKLADGDIVNIPVKSDSGALAHDAELDAEITDASFGNGTGSVTVMIYNNSKVTKTYVVTAGPAWTLDDVKRIAIGAGKSASISVKGTYEATALGIASKGMSVVVSDFNGTSSKTLPIVDGKASEAAQGVTMKTAADSSNMDKLSGAEYMYALTFVNAGPEASVKIDVNAISGYELSLMNENGSVIKAVGSTFVIPAKTTSVVYVKVMKAVGEMTTVPSITVSAGVDNGKQTLNPSTIDIEVDSMEVSGDMVYDKAKGIPAGEWFLIGLCVLLLIGILWMGNKRK